MKLTPVHKIITLFTALLISLLVSASSAFANTTITQQELDIGNTLIKQKKFSQAIVYYKKLEVKAPTDAVIKNNLAVLKAHSGNVDNAIKLLKQALNSNEISNINYANLISLFEYQTSVAYREVLANNQPRLKKPALNIIYKLPKPLKPKIIIQEVPAEPKIIIKEVIVEIPAEPKIIYKEVIKIVEAEPKIVYRDVIKEVPAKPTIIYKEVIKEAPVEAKTIYKKMPVEPKIVIKEVQTPDNNARGNSRRLILAMKAWKNAWANQSSFKYIDSYVEGYTSSKFNTHNAWKAHRINRITKPDFIKINISNIKVVNYSNSSAKIKFTQHYQSDSFEDISEKILVFKLIDDQWKITSEISL